MRPPATAAVTGSGGVGDAAVPAADTVATATAWRPARRAARLNPSALREILKLAERPGVISLAGGLPAADLFPVDGVREATARVLRDQAHEALQYAASEGHGPLREWIAGELRARGIAAGASQVLITSGSQQGLDLVGKVLVDPGSALAVESPTYLGALQAFAPFEPALQAVAGDDDGPRPDALDAVRDARFLYLQPNFQNPSGRCVGAARREALAGRAAALGLPVVEDDPYGELWFEAPPPPPLAARLGEGAIYLGSLSKVLAPGLRLGYLVAPRHLYAKLLQAKQAADLHTSGFTQRVAFEVVHGGFLRAHLPAVRARYRAQRDAMAAALAAHLPSGSRFTTPAGGMFFWITLPPAVDAAALLPHALAAGVAYVPGAPFFVAPGAGANTLRLSFVTVPPERIIAGVRILGMLIGEAMR